MNVYIYIFGYKCWCMCTYMCLHVCVSTQPQANAGGCYLYPSDHVFPVLTLLSVLVLAEYSEILDFK